MNKIKKETSFEATKDSDANPPSTTGDFSDIDAFNGEESTHALNSTKNHEKLHGGEKSKKDKNAKKQKTAKIPWWVKALIITLMLSFLFGFVSQLVIGNITTKNVIIAYLLILIIIAIAIIADIIGVAATACNVEPFLSMSARKVKGAKLAVKLSKNADIVSSICGDIIGDICGIISGACGAAIVAVVAVSDDTINLIIGVVCSAIIAAVMITGKAIGKSIAIKNANKIILNFARFLSAFSKK